MTFCLKIGAQSSNLQRGILTYLFLISRIILQSYFFKYYFIQLMAPQRQHQFYFCTQTFKLILEASFCTSHLIRYESSIAKYQSRHRQCFDNQIRCLQNFSHGKHHSVSLLFLLHHYLQIFSVMLKQLLILLALNILNYNILYLITS